MKSKFLLLTLILFYSLTSFAQDANNAYAITASGNGDFLWMNIRQIDLTTGTETNTLYERGKTQFRLLNAESKKDINLSETNNGRNVSDLQYPTATMVAAAAFDKRHNKLFFTPMALGELRWLDLSSGAENKFYIFKSDVLHPGNNGDEANHITRMTIGADGNGYAITNDGNRLIKFTTGKKILVSNLGSLIDASSNNGISVHNKCSSWGGDIVADAYGNLFLFTATKNVFKINPETRITSYIGSITGLNGPYTVNGAAVDKDDNVIISSANTMDGFYKVSIKNLTATKLNTSGQIYNASDLANANLLFSNEAKSKTGVATLRTSEVIGNQYVSIYPNPVTGTQIKISFENNSPGNYSIALTDIQGRLLTSKQVFIKSVNQVETLQLGTKPAGGMYMIKVTDANKRSVFADKIVID